MKFKYGDKVRCLNDTGYYSVKQGQIYTICDIENNYLGFKGVESEEPCYKATFFELVEEPKQELVTKFQVGDIVEAFGVKGKVLEIRDDLVYGVIVCFECENNSFELMFQMNGIYEGWHKTPSLKLIERPLPKEITFDAEVKKTNSLNDEVHLPISNEQKNLLKPYVNKKVSVTIKVLEDK